MRVDCGRWLRRRGCVGIECVQVGEGIILVGLCDDFIEILKEIVWVLGRLLGQGLLVRLWLLLLLLRMLMSELWWILLMLVYTRLIPGL